MSVFRNSTMILLSLMASQAFASKAADTWQVAITGATLANQYTYQRGLQDANHEATWTDPINKTTLNTVNTFQFNAEPLTAADTLTVTPPDADTTDNCMELFYKDQQKTAPLKSAINLQKIFTDLGGPNNSEAVHITAIPYASTDAVNCPMPASLPADHVLAIWDPNTQATLPNPANAQVCNLSGKLTVNDLPIIDSSTGCNLQKPQWSVISIKDSSGDESYALKYSGPLAAMVANQKPIVIHLENDADIQLPITTQYVEFPATMAPANVTACQNALNAYDEITPHDLTKFPYAVCGLTAAEDKFITTSDDYIRSYTYSEPMTQPIYITGSGRIDGTTTINNYLKPAVNPLNAPADRPCHAANNMGSIGLANCYIPGTDSTLAGEGGDYVRYAEWRLDTSLLGLSSSYMPTDAVKKTDGSIDTYQGKDPAIYVSGITVADTPIRNRGTVQLNVAQFGQQGSREANNTPVVVNNFKQVGSWMDASDGADIGSDGANEQNLYYQITDDSAKLEAKNQYVHNVTLLQGGVGGIMLGMYGVTRDGIDNSIVDGVYVPRITQLANAKAYNWFAATHGLISTRTCPRYFQGYEDDTIMPSLANATVQNVKVFALIDHSVDAKEPNYLASLAAVGVASDSGYCLTGFDTKEMAPQFTFGPLHLYNLDSDVAPQEPFVFYNQPVNSENPHITVLWDGVDFSNDPQKSAKFYASGTGSNEVYQYICPLQSSATAVLKCMQQVGDTDASAVADNASNVTILAPAGPASIPYLSTTVYPALMGDHVLATREQLFKVGKALAAKG